MSSKLLRFITTVFPLIHKLQYFLDWKTPLSGQARKCTNAKTMGPASSSKKSTFKRLNTKLQLKYWIKGSSFSVPHMTTSESTFCTSNYYPSLLAASVFGILNVFFSFAITANTILQLFAGKLQHFLTLFQINLIMANFVPYYMSEAGVGQWEGGAGECGRQRRKRNDEEDEEAKKARGSYASPTAS